MQKHLKQSLENLISKSDAMVEFCIRCLDFIKVVMTNQPKLTLFMPWLVTLANIVETGMRVKDYKLMVTRA